MNSISSIRSLRVALALAVAFWMAGAGCLIGCGNMVSAAAANESGAHSSPLDENKTSADSSAPANVLVVAAGDSCSSTHSHDCCAKRAVHHASKSTAKIIVKPAVKLASQSAISFQTQAMTYAPSLGPDFSATSSMMMDCPLAMNATAALSKARQDLSSHSLTSASAGESFSNNPERTAALSSPLRLPNRGHTYLRCCVFLI